MKKCNEIENAIKCKSCGETIESKDCVIKRCKCEKVGILSSSVHSLYFGNEEDYELILIQHKCNECGEPASYYDKGDDEFGEPESYWCEEHKHYKLSVEKINNSKAYNICRDFFCIFDNWEGIVNDSSK